MNKKIKKKPKKFTLYTFEKFGVQENAATLWSKALARSFTLKNSVTS